MDEIILPIGDLTLPPEVEAQNVEVLRRFGGLAAETLIVGERRRKLMAISYGLKGLRGHFLVAKGAFKKEELDLIAEVIDDFTGEVYT